MIEPKINPEKITSPIQLLGIWFVALLAITSGLLTGARLITEPAWLPALLDVPASDAISTRTVAGQILCRTPKKIPGDVYNDLVINQKKSQRSILKSSTWTSSVTYTHSREPASLLSSDLFRGRLDQIINLKHELVQLAARIDWQWIDREFFQHEFPHERSDLTHWRKRLSDKMELLLAESLRVAHQSGALRTRDLARVTIDTTVQPKAISFLTDAKLHIR